MKPNNNIIGITQIFIIAPPVAMISTKFIETSMEIIDIRLMPMAVFNALLNPSSFVRTIVSNNILVINPLIIAKAIIPNNGNSIFPI